METNIKAYSIFKMGFTFVVLLLICGCGKSNKSSNMRLGLFRNISIGMDKQDVAKQIGEPSIVSGATKNNAGNVIEIWEYCPNYFTTYKFYFCDNKLIGWGYPGNWNVKEKEEKADFVSEVRVR